MNPQVKECILQLALEFEANRNLNNAAQMKAYMRNQFEFYGIKSVQRREVLKPFFQQIKNWDQADIKDVCLLCWEKSEREYKLAAMDFMGKSLKKMDETWIPFMISLIQTESWWDTGDFLASTVIGHLLQKYPDKRNSYVNSWINSDDIWLKRTAIIHQLKYKNNTDFDLMKKLIIQEIDHPDFFIRKAIGWALRQYSRYAPERVSDFVDSHPGLSSLSKREALKLIKK